MNVKTPIAALLAVVLVAYPAGAQAPTPRPVSEITSDRAEPGVAPVPFSVSRWLTPPPCGCDSAGTNPPIGAEVYVQAGWAIPSNSEIHGKELLGRDMRLGFVVQGGVRTSFFNTAATKAWVVDTSISHLSNGHNPDRQYALRVLEFTGTQTINGPEVARIQFGTPTQPGVRIRDTDRTYVNLGMGHDWYLWSAADAPGCHLRVGWDAGGRYGTLSQEYDIIKHRTDVIGAVYVGTHGEVEIPSRWGFVQLGVRTEWGYTWSDILQQASDIQEVNILLTLGLRY